MSQQLTFLSIFLPCKKCPRYVTPCFHWPWIFEICWCIMVIPDPPSQSLPHRCLHYWTGPGKLQNPSFCHLWFQLLCFCIIPDTPIAPCPGLPCCYSKPQKEEVYGTPKLDIEPYIWTRKCKSLIFLMLLCVSPPSCLLPPHSDPREGMEYSKTSNTWTRKYLPPRWGVWRNT